MHILRYSITIDPVLNQLQQFSWPIIAHFIFQKRNIFNLTFLLIFYAINILLKSDTNNYICTIEYISRYKMESNMINSYKLSCKKLFTWINNHKQINDLLHGIVDINRKSKLDIHIDALFLDTSCGPILVR